MFIQKHEESYYLHLFHHHHGFSKYSEQHHYTVFYEKTKRAEKKQNESPNEVTSNSFQFIFFITLYMFITLTSYCY